MNNSFLEIWRNSFLQRLIRNKIFENTTILASIEYLNQNKRCFDKLNTNSQDINIIAVVQNETCQSIDLEYDPSKLFSVTNIQIPFHSFSIVYQYDHITTLSITQFDSKDHTLMFPPTLEHLFIGEKLSFPIKKGQPFPLNSRLKSLDPGYLFKGPIEKDSLPESLTLLRLGASFHSFDPNVLPPNLVSLRLPYSVDNYKEISEIYTLSNNIQNLEISFFMALNISSLPQQLKKLFAKRIYRDMSIGYLPKTLKELVLLDSNFPTPLLAPGVFHNGLTKIHFYNNSNFELVPGSLPSTLTDFKVSTNPSKPFIPGVLPPSLLHLNLYSYNHLLNKDILPRNLKTLKIPSYNQTLKCGDIPGTVHTLEFNYIPSPGCDNNGIIPNSVTSLTLPQHWTHSIPLKPGFLPSSLKHLALCMMRYPHPLEKDVIPSSVESLDLLMFYDGNSVNIHIPPSVTKLNYGSNISPGELFAHNTNITNLTISARFSFLSPPHVIIPKGVVKLKIEDVRSLHNTAIPPSVTDISFTKDNVPFHLLPKSLKTLRINGVLELPTKVN
ncbi:hypothetical protein CYY_010180 [Polysphondylium violaceum]|uniref:FNIP repeat-containing protein n=1 Tax=Polysphondylium violaceum TaxID=133409 RepID=A0A8J4PKA1_9MYCE|nr:hypothetical protein CYY_010180 [Polysphondylium violaceum]